MRERDINECEKWQAIIRKVNKEDVEAKRKEYIKNQTNNTLKSK
jgi:hypothetical protein